LLTLAVVLILGYSVTAQRVIRGTVYREGKVAAGVTVEAQKAREPFLTSFDGKYQIAVPDKSKYMKFTFLDDSKKVDIPSDTTTVINFSFDGKIPQDDNNNNNDQGAILKTADELAKAGDKEFMSQYTLERQFYEQKDYKSALSHWRTLFKTYPKSSVNIYIHGINMYQSILDKTTDRVLKDHYIDTLMMVYDKRIKYFDQKGYNLGRQGTDYLKYELLENENLTDDQLKPIMKKGYNYVEESTKLQGNDTEAPVLILLMQTSARLFGLNELPADKLLENYDLTTKIANANLAKDPNNANYLTAKDQIGQIFIASGAANCDVLTKMYTTKFNDISNNIDELKKMLALFDRQKCDDSPLYGKAAEKLYALEPSAQAAYNMARMFVKANEMDRASEYYNKAINLEKDPVTLSNDYLELAKVNLTKYLEARNYSKKAIENNPNNGGAYMFLGDIYARNAKNYGKDDFENRFLYWVAVDYFQKARKADPSLDAEAKEKIALYSQYFPSKEDIFFNGLTVGQSITLGGWVGETTTVRDKK
jgi:tetratricopeptide (TPR) repeat protein